MVSSDTRGAVLFHIVTHGGATVADLVDQMSLSDATVRRHLDKLEVEGLVTPQLVRQPTGRPYQLYKATDAGVRRQRDHSADLAARLLGQLEQGNTELMAVAEGMADQVVADHRHQVEAKRPLRERVEHTVEALRGEGILDGWEQTESGFRLHNHACPYRSAADSSDCVCESDRLVIEKLVGTNVEQLHSLVQGDASCEYLIKDTDITPASAANTTTRKRGRGARSSPKAKKEALGEMKASNRS